MNNELPNSDVQVRELVHICLRLREDLRFACDEFAGRLCYLVEDPVTSRYYRIGIDEYYFISLLDGRTTVGQAIAATAKARGRDAFTQADANAICRWLMDAGLADTDASVQPDRLMRSAQERASRRIPTRLNPLMIKLPLGNPDRALEWLLPRMNWLLGWPALAIWAVLLVTGVYQIGSQSGRFVASSTGILAPGNWLVLALCWIGLKVVHELAHGLVCKRFGGNVLEWGVVFILFAPVAYVDATGAWRLRSKWQRIYTSAAGMYAELFCAAVAALVWSYSPPGIVSHVAFQVIMMAGFSTLLVNGNPLMRFDAYYMLADYLELPNLGARGQFYLLYLGRRYVMGVPAEAPREPPAQRFIIRLYGILACLWRFVVLAGLLMAAYALLMGAGIVLAIIAAGLWFGVPIVRFVQYLVRGNSVEAPNVVRFLATVGSTGALAALILLTVPWPGVIRAPAVVRPLPMSIVRSDVSGFVEEIMVTDNQRVTAGQVLARIDGRETEADLKDLEIEIQEAEQRRDLLRREGEVSAVQIQTRYIQALQQRLVEKQRQAAQLTIRAPIDGHVLARNLKSRLGTYVEPGDELLKIAGPNAELVVSIGQDDLDMFTERVSRPVHVRLDGHRATFRGTVARISPHASRQVPFAALAAASGGPLAVRSVARPSASGPNSREQAFEFIVPRFDGVIRLQGRSPLWVGQSAWVWFRTNHETIGEHVYRQISRWVRKRTRGPRLAAIPVRSRVIQ